MPEGPEVRTMAEELNLLAGHRLYGVGWVEGTGSKILDALQALNRLVALRPVLGRVGARGKLLYFQFEFPTSKEDEIRYLSSNLGMSGGWSWTLPEKNVKCWLAFETPEGDSYRVVYYSDQRNFGLMDFYASPSDFDTRIKSSVGFDLLDHALYLECWSIRPCSSDDHVWTRWCERLTSSKVARRPICVQLLTHQKEFAGIGNYLKCEILYRARVSPFRTLGSLSPEEVESIYRHALIEIVESYRKGGLSFKSYRTVSGQKGVYVPQVYKRSITVDGEPVVHTRTKDGRNTYWVPALQS